MNEAGQLTTGIVFVLYLVAMVVPAIIAGRQMKKSGSTMAEYFLGSRSMSSWVLALSFAATCISGGTFAGFPAKIYTHGWVLLLWIGSYMVFPLVAMGLMGKRLNQIAQQTGAITIPDVLRQRFGSSALGIFGSLSIMIFLTVNLVSQFKAGGLILDVLLQDTPGYRETILPAISQWPGMQTLAARLGPGYVLSLMLFAVTVVMYTSYGGFRAVVWTDTLQGLVMLVGMFILLPSVLSAAGGLGKVTEQIRNAPPSVTIGNQLAHNALRYESKDGLIASVQHRVHDQPYVEPTVVLESAGDGRSSLVVTAEVDDAGRVKTTADDVVRRIEADPAMSSLSVVHVGPTDAIEPSAIELTRGPVVFSKPEDRLLGPSRSANGSWFHPLGAAISFFFLWPISGAGHPGFLVRLMAFRNSRDLRHAMITVTVYFAFTYIALVLIFVAASVLVDPSELAGGPDAIMPTVAKRFAHPLLAGLLLAAPFSAVMSTVSSFLLVISSSLVRDIYQQSMKRSLSERGAHRLSQWVTLVVGSAVAGLALDPPEFLQDFVILASEGISATFLAATFLGIYWSRMTTAGAWGAMLSGFGVVAGCQLPVIGHRLGIVANGDAILPFGMSAFIWACGLSFFVGIAVSLMSPARARRSGDAST